MKVARAHEHERTGLVAHQTPHELKRFLRILKQQLPRLRQKYHITSIGVFGSYVREAQRKQSDLDVLVEFSEPPSLFEFIELEHELADLLEIKIDLVMKSALKPRIGASILSEVITV